MGKPTVDRRMQSRSGALLDIDVMNNYISCYRVITLEGGLDVNVSREFESRLFCKIFSEYSNARTEGVFE